MLISSLLYICNWLLPALHGTIKTARIVHVYSFIFLLHFARLSIDVLRWASSVTQLGLTYAMHMTATHKTHKTVWRLNSCLVGCFPFFVVAHIAHAKLAHEDRKRKILHKKKKTKRRNAQLFIASDVKSDSNCIEIEGWGNTFKCNTKRCYQTIAFHWSTYFRFTCI